MFSYIGAVQPSFRQGIPCGSALGVARRTCHSSAIIGVVAKRLYMVHGRAPSPPINRVNPWAAFLVPKRTTEKSKTDHCVGNGPVPTGQKRTYCEPRTNSVHIGS